MLRIAKGVLLRATLVLVAMIFLFPLFWMVTTSLKSNSLVFTYPPVMLPDTPHFENYPRAFSEMDYLLQFRNSAVVTLLAMLGEVLSAPFIAYGFARFRFPGRNALFTVMLSTMMIPFALTMVPLYMMYNSMGWINTLLPLIVPYFFGTPMYIFMCRQFIMTIPRSLDEAALIDGASYPRIYTSIMLPALRPCLVVVALLQFRNVWNDFLMPLIFLQNKNLYTLTIGLQTFQRLLGVNDYAFTMAGAVMVVIPPIVLFFFFQKQFIQGTVTAGIKG